LIDEYDKPFTDFIDDHEMAEKVRVLLRDYYSKIKSSDEYIHFIFITGISKFTKMGVFSTLNNLIAEKALRQIVDNHYAKPYPDAFCIGMAIDDSVRQITKVNVLIDR